MTDKTEAPTTLDILCEADSGELTPCPFCGGEAKLRVSDMGAGYNTSIARCTKCKAKIAKTGLDADKYWNTRTQAPDTITIRRDVLENMNHSEASAKNGYYCTGFNAAIDAILQTGVGEDGSS